MTAVVPLALRYLLVALAMAPAAARADDKPAFDVPREIALDIDGDGRMDRAVLVQRPDRVHSDLLITLAAGDDKHDPSRKPSILKADITTSRILAFESRGKSPRKQSLVIVSGCGGCSNDRRTTLTIVHRGGQFWVAGFAYAWDTRAGIGSCDINYLTGTGVMSRGLARDKPIKARFTPIRLADWSDRQRPKGCD